MAAMASVAMIQQHIYAAREDTNAFWGKIAVRKGAATMAGNAAIVADVASRMQNAAKEEDV